MEIETKKYSKDNIKRYKARLVQKVLPKKDELISIVSLVSCKDSFRIIIALVTFDIELHQIDAKTIFLNGYLKEKVDMQQQKGYM